MERFLKKRKLETDEEAEDLRQPDEAAANGSDAISSKLSRSDEINLQIKIRQYCENSGIYLDWKLRLPFTFVYFLWGEAS